MRARELIAALVVLVGGTLWLVVPDRQSGSLHDASAPARWRLPVGRGLVAWVVVQNRGTRTIRLRDARVGSALPPGATILGTKARIGPVPTVDDAYPGPPGPFLRLEGFEIPAGRFATIGFGLRLDRPGEVRLEDVRVDYAEDDSRETLRIRRTARVRVVSPRAKRG